MSKLWIALEDRKSWKRRSIEALPRLLAEWQEKLSDTAELGRTYGTGSIPFQKAAREFHEATWIVADIEMHLGILQRLGGCDAIVFEVRSLFECGPGKTVDMCVGHHSHGEGLKALVNQYTKMTGGAETYPLPPAPRWIIEATFQEFEQWSYPVQSACRASLKV